MSLLVPWTDDSLPGPFHRIQGNTLPLYEVKLTRAKLCAMPLTKLKAEIIMV